jgi:Putative  PD-(D/E)XK family member, (DUF4420)
VAVDLASLYELLVLPLGEPSGTNLSAVEIPESQTHRLAKDANGSPCLLLRQPSGTTRPTPIRLQNLFVSYDVPCKITHASGTQEQGNFTIIKCSNSDPKLFPHFLRIISPMVIALGPTPTSAAVRRAISGLVELFQALTAPAGKSIQGIWGELFVIRKASDPTTVAAAWHRTAEEHFDFAAGPQRVEVKTSSNRRREHHFSLAQLTSPAPSHVVIASVFVERVGGGVSLRRLFEETRQLLSHDPILVTQFDASFYAGIGAGWSDAMDECFDWELAQDSLAFFDSKSVPKIEGEIPPTVSQVRFCSDLTAITPLEWNDLLGFGALLAAARPSAV